MQEIRPDPSAFTPNAEGIAKLNDDIQDLLPWLRESRDHAVAAWSTLTNVVWRKGDLEFTLSYRATSAYLTELISGRADTMELYLSGPPAKLNPHVYRYMLDRGWSAYHLHDWIQLAGVRWCRRCGSVDMSLGSYLTVGCVVEDRERPWRGASSGMPRCHAMTLD